MRIVDTFITADGRVTQDPALAVRLDRDVYDDAGQLISRETWRADPAAWTPEEWDLLSRMARDDGWGRTLKHAGLTISQARALGDI